ncbi:MAG: sugar transferase [Paludibacter sp.]|jgi:exopolysaccharide biosynthesis polyprenyl glycosylphosphotransferase|nr:sugar transferase [Paludibacter sp.]
MNKRLLLEKFIIYDALAAVVAGVLFMLYRRMMSDMALFVFTEKYTVGLFIFPFVCLFFHWLSGFYLHVERMSIHKCLFTTFVVSCIVSVGIFFIFMIDDVVISNSYYYNSLLAMFTLLFVCTFFVRVLLISDVKNNYKNKRWSIKTIIIGNGQNAEKIAASMERETGNRNALAGFVAVDNRISVPRELVLGKIHNLEEIIVKNGVEEAIIALDEPNEQKLFAYINTLYRHNLGIKFTPRLYEILTGSARIGSFGIQPLVCITDLNMPDWQVCIKRFFDILASAVAVLLLLPLFAYFAIAIKLDSKGRVFYLQERVGYLGKPFKIIKFRSMYSNSENGSPRLSSPDDERITRIGRILRRYRLDELPQFWNILRGDMSIVGPRPERRFYINQIIEQAPYYCLIYKIRPGLTSWGPIKIGYSDSIEKMVERLNYDIIYIENMSLLNDLKILLLTAEIIFKGQGM